MTHSRNKGASGERELFKIISGALGVDVERNLIQSREGGADTTVGAFAVEVKRQERLLMTEWWTQAVNQAIKAKKMPMLFYRQSRKPWRARMWARDYLAIYGCSALTGAVIELDMLDAIEVIRMTLQKNC